MVNDPDTVNALLDHLGDKVLALWMDHKETGIFSGICITGIIKFFQKISI